VNVLLRLLIGTGRLPDDVREVLAAEGVAVLEEGLSGSLTLRDYRAPGRRASWKKSAVSGAIAVTGRRLLVWVGGAANIDVPLDHPGRSAVGVEAETPDRVCFTYDAAAFHDDRSGQVEVRFRTPGAAHVVDALRPR
jgi:hypothetical protein